MSKQTEKDMTTYSLIENGEVHTTNLTKEQADEMLERHSRIFDDIDWCIRPDQSTDIPNEGILERHNRIAVTYFQP